MVIRRLRGVTGLRESETILLRFERALSPTDISRFPRTRGAQNYIFGNYDRAMRGRKRFLEV